jgi:tetratricopeptide (TPR) repeat protein
MTQPPLDDTQPVRPVRPPVGRVEPVDPYEGPLLDPDEESFEDEGHGVGCGISVLLLGIIGVFALVIVGLSATAGWTSGQRLASVNATATSVTDLKHQIDLVSADIAAANYERADIRLRYLATQAPNLSSLPQLMQTGTALYVTRQPTTTPTPTETPTETATSPGPTAEPTAEATPTLADPFDLGGRLQRAQSAVSLAQWNDAIDDLDVILSIDPNYETATVRSLMSRALNAQALALFRSGDLGEAIFLTDRAEEFGELADGLEFERYVAQLYLNAQSRVGTSDYTGVITPLAEIRRVAPNYRNTEINQLLFQNYVNYADALMFGSPCAAVQQYTNALQLFSDGLVSNKRATAQNYCEFGTPTPEGFVPTPDPANPGGGGTAPIGQP